MSDTITVTEDDFRYNDKNELHCEDGPARRHPDGTVEYFINGKRHRDGDEPATTTAHGTKTWYKHDKLHRVHGPAVTHPDGEIWWFNGEQHRWDGPAVQVHEVITYFLFGQQTTKEVVESLPERLGVTLEELLDFWKMPAAYTEQMRTLVLEIVEEAAQES